MGMVARSKGGKKMIDIKRKTCQRDRSSIKNGIEHFRQVVRKK